MTDVSVAEDTAQDTKVWPVTAPNRIVASPTAHDARSDLASDLPVISGHHAALDGVRAVAAFAVLLFHVAASTGYITEVGALSWLMSRGDIGVPIFFVLSGLLLYRPWAASVLGLRSHSPRAGKYLWKRATRLLPAYWALVVVAMLLYARDHLTDVWTWLKLLTLTYSYDPHPWWNNYLGPKGLGQIWSLTVEAAFYAALPLTAAALAWWARRGGDDVHVRARRLLYGLGVYGGIALLYGPIMLHSGNSAFTGMWLPRYTAWFAIGMALAVVSVWAHAEQAESERQVQAPAAPRTPDGMFGAVPAVEAVTPAPPDGPVRRFSRTVAHSWGMCWLAAAVLYCMAATPLTGRSRLVVDTIWTTQLHIVLYGLVAGLFIAPVALAPAGHRMIGAVLGNRVMSFLGKISYSVFLWQFVVMYVWFDVTGHPPFTGYLLTDFPVCAALTVLVSTLSYYLIEEPVRRLIRH